MAFTVTKRIRPDISVSGRPADIRVKQYDSGARELLATLTDGGRPVPIPADCAAVLYARGPDGTETAVSCSVEPDGQVRVPIPSGITALAGRVRCELRITDGDGHTVCSLTFCVTVEAGINPDIAAADGEKLGVLSSLIASCRELEEKLKDTQTSAPGLTSEQVALLEKVLNGLVYADTDSPASADALIASLKGKDAVIAVTGVRVSPAAFALNVAQQYVLSASILPADYTEAITDAVWSSDNEAVATVNQAGQVTALKAGTAQIKYTVTCAGGTYSGASGLEVKEVQTVPDSVTVVLSVLGGTASSTMETYEIQDGVVDYQFTVDDTFETGGTFFVYRTRSSGLDSNVETLTSETDYTIDAVTGGYNVQIFNCEKDDYYQISYSPPSEAQVTTATGTGITGLTYAGNTLNVTMSSGLSMEPNQIIAAITDTATKFSNVNTGFYYKFDRTNTTWSCTKIGRAGDSGVYANGAYTIPPAAEWTGSSPGAVTVTYEEGTYKISSIQISSWTGSPEIKFYMTQYTVTASYV